MTITSLKEFFGYLNHSCKYLVLRNWDNLLDDDIYVEDHEDIDILCDDLHSFIRLSGARRIHKECDRDNYMVVIEEKRVRLDVRWIGDGYYPSEWERKMLERRVMNYQDVYIPCPEDHFYSLSYHALIQKPSLSSEYLFKLSDLYASISNVETKLDEHGLITLLVRYLSLSSYKVTLPKDPGVLFNKSVVQNMSKEIDIILLFKRRVFKFKQRIRSYFKRFDNRLS